MVDEYEMEASMEVAEQIRGNQPGRINTPERKEARVRARLAAEQASAEAKAKNFVYAPDEHNRLQLVVPPKPGFWARLWRWLRG